jgi:CRISP-associated protein Cas1
MATLYLTEQGVTMTKTDGRLVVRKDGKILQDLPAIHIDQIVVFGNAHFTMPAVNFILQEGIDVAYLSSHGTYRGRLQHAVAKDATLRQAQYHQAQDPAFCLAMAQGFIRGKVHNALVFVQRQQAKHTDIRASLNVLRQMERQIPTAASLDVLRGYEGTAAAAFFRAFRVLLKYDLGFRTRVHHPPTDPVNVLLSLGYTLLYNQTFAAINIVGLDPYLGFFHQTRHGHATLASDLIEEWRTLLVDSVVLGMINRGEFSVTDFRTTRQGQLQLRSEGLNRFLKAYDARVQSSVLYAPSQQQLQYLRCIEMQVRQVAQVLSNQQAAYQPYTTR